MKEKKTKKKNYELRSKVWRGTGFLTIGATTLGGTFGYLALTDFQNFAKEISNFFVVDPETVKLNGFIALPLLIGFMVYVIIMLKKNKEILKGTYSLKLFFIVVIMYFIYSVIEISLVAASSALVGLVVDEGVLLPISRKNKLKADEEKDFDLEYEREKRRIQARLQAQKELDLDGSV